MNINWLVVLALTAYAAEEKLKNGVLNWQVAKDQVKFTLHVDPSIFRDYDWYGVAFKENLTQYSMADGDYSVVWFNHTNPEKSKVHHMNTIGHHELLHNTKMYFGTQSASSENNGLVATWTRNLNESTNQTVALVENKHYLLLWAYGKLQGNAMQHHMHSDRYYGVVTLSQNHTGDAENSAFHLVISWVIFNLLL